MVFSNLQEHEKGAFFALLDEYFSTRPHLLAGGSGPGVDGGSNAGTSGRPSPSVFNDPGAAAASVVGRAIVAHPEASARLVSSGFRHMANSRGVLGAGGGGNNNSTRAETPPGATADGDQDDQPSSVASRIAALSKSRVTGGAPPPRPDKPSSASSLVSAQKFGNVDVSSKSGFVSSLRGSNPSPPAAPPLPPAFASRKSDFAPPPTRRVASNTAPPARQSAPDSDEEEAPPPAPAPPPPRPPGRRPQEPQGEWVEAIYDYNPTDSGDLSISEGDRILLVERTSDDWWTGELNGEKGLFPASYVKPL